ncbi:hypothetical protein K435DRAFT_788808 [Dendrothele bispora CBS 962.96]|uniref:3-carboxymuconate cyclase n=1 Tax=Dendrothele bispora (strain CBS 962.96) TaxID=1314807 RepID=A0A4S8MY62_DENBC|nr:hypothetical protein K435DRAFT_788808 [Dendrothele bispora CBS 962.96]
MKLSYASVLVSVILGSASLVSSSPIKQHKKMTMGAAKGQAMGAAYFITNEDTGNFVVSADIGTDGKLNLRQALFTGGFGQHGDDGAATPGPDGTFTQGAVKVSAASNMLATVNPGSNTLSLFAINPADPSNLKQVGLPVSSGGEFPVSVAFNSAGSTLCAVNGGEVNGVNCFKVDQTKGLVPISGTNRDLGLNQTTPANGPPGTVSHIVFSEDGSKLIASVKGVPPTPGFLAIWDVAADGSLSQDFQSLQPANGGLLPFSMTLIKGKNAILATDAGIGFDIFDFNAAGNAGNGSAVVAAGQSSANAIDGQVATCWSSFSPKTGNFYLTDIGTSMVTEVNVDDSLKGTLVKQYPQGNGTSTIDNDIASVGDNDFMYVLQPGNTAVSVLSLNAPGQAQNVQSLDIAGPAKAAGLTVGISLQGMTTFIKK